MAADVLLNAKDIGCAENPVMRDMSLHAAWTGDKHDAKPDPRIDSAAGHVYVHVS